MFLYLAFVLSVCSALNVRFEDTQGRPVQPVHREEYVYKNINGRMEQFPSRPEADTQDVVRPGQGREVYIRYIVNPPEDGQIDDNMNYHNKKDDELYPHYEEVRDKSRNSEPFTNKNGRLEPEYAMDNVQNDQPSPSYTPRHNEVSSQSPMKLTVTTPRTNQRSSTNNKKQKNSSINQRTTTAKPKNMSTTRKGPQRKNIQTSTERLTSRSGAKDIEYSKSTRDNEVTPTEVNKRVKEDEGERWVWMNGGNVTLSTVNVTPVSVANVTFEDRASFTGDQCPTGQVKYNGKCVDAD